MTAGREAQLDVPSAGVVVVGTPIGNLGDLSPRAVAALAAADVVCCEDTRRTRALLSATGVAAPRLLAVHRHNEAAGAARAVSLAADGGLVVVVSDAGMPGVSDPGARVVQAALDAGVAVSVVPGPTAATAAVALSGLDAGRWCFEGFLPRAGAERAARLVVVAGEARPSVLYEAPHRVARTLADLRDACGAERTVVVGRELTKLHEEVWRGTLATAAERWSQEAPRGEWVLVVAGAPPAVVVDEAIVAALRDRLATGVSRREAVVAVAAALDAPRRRVYALALQERDENG